VPAAAVIPALIAYIKVVAVKKLVVGSRDGIKKGVEVRGRGGPPGATRGDPPGLLFPPPAGSVRRLCGRRAPTCPSLFFWLTRYSPLHFIGWRFKGGQEEGGSGR